MNDEKDVWGSSKDATWRRYQEAAGRGNDHELPKGCWIFLGYSFALVLMVGGMLLLVTLVHFASIRRLFLVGSSLVIVIVSLVILAGGILLTIVTTKSLH